MAGWRKVSLVAGSRRALTLSTEPLGHLAAPVPTERGLRKASGFGMCSRGGKECGLESCELAGITEPGLCRPPGTL